MDKTSAAMAAPPAGVGYTFNSRRVGCDLVRAALLAEACGHLGEPWATYILMGRYGVFVARGNYFLTFDGRSGAEAVVALLDYLNSARITTNGRDHYVLEGPGTARMMGSPDDVRNYYHDYNENPRLWLTVALERRVLPRVPELARDAESAAEGAESAAEDAGPAAARNALLTEARGHLGEPWSKYILTDDAGPMVVNTQHCVVEGRSRAEAVVALLDYLNAELPACDGRDCYELAADDGGGPAAGLDAPRDLSGFYFGWIDDPGFWLERAYERRPMPRVAELSGRVTKAARN